MHFARRQDTASFMTNSAFSRRTGWESVETEWAKLLRSKREMCSPDGNRLCDLTISNPTECGFHYDEPEILAALTSPAVLRYAPNPKGAVSAREAVALYYRDHSASVDHEQTLLTASTSEAYSYLFRLLCDPGDEVLIAQPSYPLFDFLAALDDVRLVAYPLFYDHGWHIDVEALRQRITSRTRAIIVVHPNNPTGHFTKSLDRLVLEAICVEHGLALIVDEVFLDYHLGVVEPPQSFATGDHPALTFVLSGLSKVAGLPQMKAAWIACFGPGRALFEALDRLEIIGDTFLSMNAPVQAALPQWLGCRDRIQEQIRKRIQANLQVIDEAFVGQTLVKVLAVEGGWSAVLRIPALELDAHTALVLLQAHNVAVHSGEFYSFARSGWLIVSLLGTHVNLRCGLSRITNFFLDKE